MTSDCGLVTERQSIEYDAEARRSLSQRPMPFLALDDERNVFGVYYRVLKGLGEKLPALIPQVCCITAGTARRGRTLVSERMDFLLLFSDAGCVVIEVDGSQHFAEDGKPSLVSYADMVAADRDLRLAGYDAYRFGANEFTGHGSTERSATYFRR